jgi:hypothetical protein
MPLTRHPVFGAADLGFVRSVLDSDDLHCLNAKSYSASPASDIPAAPLEALNSANPSRRTETPFHQRSYKLPGSNLCDSYGRGKERKDGRQKTKKSKFRQKSSSPLNQAFNSWAHMLATLHATWNPLEVLPTKTKLCLPLDTVPI